MLVVKKHSKSEFEEKKSKFISHICPYSEFDSLLKTLKDEHPKARHFVYAYRYLNQYSQIVENSSDDGEPKGTSGKPTLAPLQGKEIVNTAIITVRYFGGVKLGTGGLVRAYSDSANLAIKDAEFFEYEDEDEFVDEVEYSNLQRFEYLANKHKIKIINKDFSQNVILTIKTTKEKYNNFKKELNFI